MMQRSFTESTNPVSNGYSSQSRNDGRRTCIVCAMGSGQYAKSSDQPSAVSRSERNCNDFSDSGSLQSRSTSGYRANLAPPMAFAANSMAPLHALA
jgi:hypothetical protein